MTYIGLALGAGFGYFLAHRRNGRLLDKLHYAAAFAIVFGLVAMAANIAVLRLL